MGEEEEAEDKKRERREEKTGGRNSMKGKRREMSQLINYLRIDKNKRSRPRCRKAAEHRGL